METVAADQPQIGTSPESKYGIRELNKKVKVATKENGPGLTLARR
jgi:hypothetical protein